MPQKCLKGTFCICRKQCGWTLFLRWWGRCHIGIPAAGTCFTRPSCNDKVCIDAHVGWGWVGWENTHHIIRLQLRKWNPNGDRSRYLGHGLLIVSQILYGMELLVHALRFCFCHQSPDNNSGKDNGLALNRCKAICACIHVLHGLSFIETQLTNQYPQRTMQRFHLTLWWFTGNVLTIMSMWSGLDLQCFIRIFLMVIPHNVDQL